MTSTRTLEKLHKVNYYVPHVHLTRIKEGRIREDFGLLVDFASTPPFILFPTPEMLENHGASLRPVSLACLLSPDKEGG